jgi:hypothetical protein
MALDDGANRRLVAVPGAFDELGVRLVFETGTRRQSGVRLVCHGLLSYPISGCRASCPAAGI